MYWGAAFGIIMLIALAFWMTSQTTKEAMAKCQTVHSYGECVYAIQ